MQKYEKLFLFTFFYTFVKDCYGYPCPNKKINVPISYLSGINKELKHIGDMTMSNNKRIGDNAKVFERNISDLLQQVTLIKGNLRALAQDPSSISRY